MIFPSEEFFGFSRRSLWYDFPGGFFRIFPEDFLVCFRVDLIRVGWIHQSGFWILFWIFSRFVIRFSGLFVGGIARDGFRILDFAARWMFLDRILTDIMMR